MYAVFLVRDPRQLINQWLTVRFPVANISDRHLLSLLICIVFWGPFASLNALHHHITACDRPTLGLGSPVRELREGKLSYVSVHSFKITSHK